MNKRTPRRGSWRWLATPMPRFAEIAGRRAPFGTLDQTDVTRILTNESLFQDGPPSWPRGVKAADAEYWWLQSVKHLKITSAASSVHSAGIVKSVIARCAPDSRCGSNGCYLCARAFQRWLIPALTRLYGHSLDSHADYSINCVFAEGQARRGLLHQIKFKKIMRETVALLESLACVRHGFLAFDISLTDDTAKGKAGRFKEPPFIYWQVHLYGIVRTSNPKEVAGALKGVFSRNEKIYRTVVITHWKCSNAAISYSFKPTAFRRVSFWATGWVREFWDTNDYALKKTDHVEYLVQAHKLGICDRVGLVNLHPISTNSKKGGKSIALRQVTLRKRKAK